MAQIINLPTFHDERGSLTVLEKIIPFEIQRLYYIYNVTSKRGGHKHKKTIQACICIGGSCVINIHNDKGESRILLDHPGSCLIVYPEDWHTMDEFSTGSTLLVLASECYDKDDYIYENC